MAPKKSKQDAPTKLREAFDMFDANGDGKLSADEIAAVLGRQVKGKAGMTPEQAKAEAEKIIANFDLNGDGELDVDEFVHFWKSKTALDMSTVAGKCTVVVEPTRGQRVGFDEVEAQMEESGAAQALVRRGSNLPLDDPALEQILLLLDPRPIFHLMMSGIAEWPEAVKAKTTVFVLVPSSTSSKEAMFMAEIGVQNFGCYLDVCRPDYTTADVDGRVRFVRLDDYMEAGDAILVAMLEQGAHYYPSEEKESMLQLVGPRKELGGATSIDAHLLEPHKGWKHWVTGAGRLAEDIKGAIDTCYVPTLTKGVGLPHLPADQKSSLGWHAVWPTAQSKQVLCFNDAAKARHDHVFGGKLLVIDAFQKDFVEGEGEDAEGYETINGSRDFVNTFGGGVYGATKEPFLIVEAEDLVGAKNLIGAGARRPYHDFLLDYRVRCSYDLVTIVFTAASFDELVSNKWLVPAIHEAIENSDVIIFATHDELPQVQAFYSNPKYTNENTGIALCAQCVPIPVCHLFTLKSAMGQELVNGEIIAPAVTLGSAKTQGSGIPKTKFNCASDKSPFFLRDDTFEPLVERVLPAARAAKDVTLIQPGKLLQKILNKVSLPTEPAPTWDGVYGEEFKGIDTDDKLQDANTNLKDLAAIYAKVLAPP